MAGDWIEYEKALPEKPKVLQIAGILRMDRYAVVGRLLEIWSWFDAHTEDGNAIGVTKEFLDERVGVTGFCNAMKDAGWMTELHEPCNGLSVTNFSKHNGESAKKRLKTNQRVANHRKKAKKKQECNAESVTKSVTTEQNRTEYINTHTLSLTDQEMISQEPGDGPSVWQVISGTKKHRMFETWQPEQNELEMVCATSTVKIHEITPEIIGKVVSYWLGEAKYNTPRQWCLKLIDQVKHDKLQGGRHGSQKRSSSGRGNFKQSKYSDVQDILEGESDICRRRPSGEREVNPSYQTSG